MGINERKELAGSRGHGPPEEPPRHPPITWDKVCGSPAPCESKPTACSINDCGCRGQRRGARETGDEPWRPQPEASSKQITARVLTVSSERTWRQDQLTHPLGRGVVLSPCSPWSRGRPQVLTTRVQRELQRLLQRAAGHREATTGPEGTACAAHVKQV